jgi:ubiquinone biosynthesis protein
VNDKEKLIKAGFDLNKLAGNLALSFFNQAFADGFFHADLHPGNILIMNDGRIALVDFGIMGFLNKKNKFFIAQTLYSFIKRDYARVAELHFDIGYVPASQSKEHFTIACRSIGEPIIGMKTNQISIGILMKQLFAISHDFQMELQPSLLLLQKTIITVEGVSATLYPEVNLWEFLEPYITKWAKSTFGAKAKLQNSYQASFKTLLNIKKLVDDRIATPTIIQTSTNSKKYLYFTLGVISALALQLLAMRFLF